MNTMQKLDYVSKRDGTWSDGRALNSDGHDITDRQGEAITVDKAITQNEGTINAFLFTQLSSAASRNRTSSDAEDRTHDKEACEHIKYLFSNYGVPVNSIMGANDQLLPEGSLDALYTRLTTPNAYHGNYDTHLLSDLSTRFSHGDGVPPSQFVALELSILATLLPTPNVTASHNAPLLLKTMNDINPNNDPSYTPSEALISTLEEHNIVEKFEAFLDNPIEATKNIFPEQYVASRNLDIK